MTSQGQERRAARVSGVLATPLRVGPHYKGDVLDANGRLVAVAHPWGSPLAQGHAAALVAVVNAYAAREADCQRLEQELRVARVTASALAGAIDVVLAYADHCRQGALVSMDYTGNVLGRLREARAAVSSGEPRRDDDPVHTVRDDFAPDGLAVRP